MSLQFVFFSVFLQKSFSWRVDSQSFHPMCFILVSILTETCYLCYVSVLCLISGQTVK